MKFDDIVIHLGEFGTYQKRVYVLSCIPAIFAAFQMMASVFYLAIPEYRCSLPGVQNDTFQSQGLSHSSLVNNTVPWEKEDALSAYKLSKCNIYNNSTVNNNTHVCSDWVYDKATFTSTALSEFNIVCDSKGWRATSNSIYFGGSLIGAIFLGFLSDFIGRKKTFFLSVLLHSASSIAIAFAPNWIGFVALRFINGAANTGLYMASFVIALELVGPSKRVIAGIVIDFFWCFGLFVLAGVAYGIRDWHNMQLVLSVPSVLMLFMYPFIPESARWLLSRGRYEEAEKIIRKAAEVNGVELPPKLFDRSTLQENEQHGKVWEMFTSPTLFFRTLIIFINWCVITLTYYGLGLNVQNLSGNIYLNFTVANVVETFAYFLCLVLLERVGRKKLHCASMFLGGLACIATIFPVIYGDKSHVWIVTTLNMIGKLGASAAFGIIYVFSAELFPTVVRNSGMGTSSTCARVGGIISPFIADLGIIVGGDLKQALPLLVFGALTIAAGLLALLLPETKGRKLPESITDAKNFGKGNDEYLDPPKTGEQAQKTNGYTNEAFDTRL